MALRLNHLRSHDDTTTLTHAARDQTIAGDSPPTSTPPEHIVIKEVIVVEGRDDITAVKRAVDAEIIATHGWGFPRGTLERLRTAHARRGLIILTDPDTAGERIRQRIVAEVGPCKHARLPRDLCTHGADIGVENASPEVIRAALEMARADQVEASEARFSRLDLHRAGLVGGPNASARRRRLGDALGLGYGNARRLLERLNHYGVTRDEFDAALNTLDDDTSSST